jgi:hypothetical protein
VDEWQYFYETVYNQYADPGSPGGTYWWWWKSCGATAPASVTPAQLDNVFPVFDLVPLSLAEATSRTTDLANKFGIGGAQGAQVIAADIITRNNSLVVTDPATGKELEVDKTTGQFYLFDPNDTFGGDIPGAQAASTLTPAQEQQAKEVADAFLAANGLDPADAQFTTVDSIIQGQSASVGSAGVEEVLQENTMGLQVIYNRYLEATVPSLERGLLQTTTVQIPVDGPGAKLKVYVDPSQLNPGIAAAQQITPAVVGAMGGWQQIRPTTVQAQQAGYPILEESKVISLFQVLEKEVAFAQIPFPEADTKTIISSTLTGFQEPAGQSQDVIYPAYRFQVRYEGVISQTTTVITGFTWMPANPEFMRPLAKIASHSVLSDVVAGSVITATAMDASMRLSELGFDANLDFVMGSADAANPNDYFYNWYLGPVDGTPNATGINLNYTITAEDLAAAGDQLLITLEVEVVGHDHTSLSTSTTAMVEQLTVKPANNASENVIFLPGVQKD